MTIIQKLTIFLASPPHLGASFSLKAVYSRNLNSLIDYTVNLVAIWLGKNMVIFSVQISIKIAYEKATVILKVTSGNHKITLL